MMLKLYKKDPDATLYWEAWDEEEEIVIHFGELGKTGETNTIPLPEFEPPEAAIHREAQLARDAGFHEIEHEDLYELIVRYPVKNKGGLEDLEVAYRLEEILNDALGWTGLGYCDMHELSAEHIDVYNYVVDPKIAIQPLIADLGCSGLLDELVIAYQDKNEQFVVVWPENFAGVFDY
jgi:hypothetical protein